MTERAGLGGRGRGAPAQAEMQRHHRALAEEAGVLFAQLVEAIRAAEGDKHKALYVTGAAAWRTSSLCLQHGRPDVLPSSKLLWPIEKHPLCAC